MITDWKKISVSSQATMREVMLVIDRGVMQIALVVDDGCHLKGTVTDGDIRRALLSGNELDTTVHNFMNSTPISGLVDEDAPVWQRTMQRHSLYHLPLLNANGCVVGLVRYEPPEEPVRDNTIVIMAGGMGSRLSPLTKSVPKPLLKVGTKPVLETIVESFSADGFHRFYFCLNYKGDMIRNYFGDGSKWNVEIEYIEEPKPLGTAGALGLIGEKITTPFFVMNGDVLTKVDFVRLLEFHKKKNYLATMCVREYHYQIPYGVVELKDHNLQKLTEKPVQNYFVNAGIYMLQPEILTRIRKNQYLDMSILFSALIKEKQAIGTFPLREYWIDIGQIEHFEQAHNDFEANFS